MFRSLIGDALNRVTARVTREGALFTAISGAHPIEKEVLNTPFAAFFTIDGVPQASGGLIGLNVNGAVNNVDAYLRSVPDGDLYLTTLSVLISDSGIRMDRFGGISALTNGVQLIYQITRGASVFPLPLRTNADIIRIATLTQGLGSKIDAYQISNAAADGEDAYLPTIDLRSLCPSGFGLRIRKDSSDRLGVKVRDDLSSITAFNILATGYLRIIPEGE